MIPPTVSPDASLPPAVAGPAFLRDGTEVWVRPVLDEDRELVLDFLGREATEAIELRHFAAVRAEAPERERIARSSPADRLCLLVLGEHADQVAIVGVGEYVRLGPGAPVAEIAFLVAASFRGLGVASLLLARLARAARAFGLVRFEARVREEDSGILEVFQGRGLPFGEGSDEGEVDVFIPLDPEVGQAGSAQTTRRGQRAGPRTADGGRSDTAVAQIRDASAVPSYVGPAAPDP